MNCFRHENSDQSDLFFQSKNVKLFDIPLLPTKPAENSHFWQIKVEADFKVHILIFGWNLGTCVRIWKCVRFCRAIWFHPHHRHLVCCVHLANPMCTGIDVLCQGDWCPLPPQPAAALASSSSSSCPNLSFCSARTSVVMIRRVYRGHNLFWLCTALHCCISKFSAHYVFSLFVPGTHLVGMVGEIGYIIPSTPEQQPDNNFLLTTKLVTCLFRLLCNKRALLNPPPLTNEPTTL